ncbi:hypothetical protein LY90DRAFT_670523 [Neocallimastix californiae]|uniref:RING-type domain-containing protein n=1 Tax=Neocallimastix californiae TaxID=1754190 RepID=A0A1Y2D0Y3_9FUNG|nr:hypothetical protein LY90DRAFT_670523 [Neocallimastix californiae]|eukprot:ORY52255.1 hypothetical protein LY90DRAFT_670523 [Neocallimastix californiae]
MNKFNNSTFKSFVLIILIYISLIQVTYGKSETNLFNQSKKKIIYVSDISSYSTIKDKKIDYEQIEYFYDLWINTYFKKKNFELTCDNIMNYLMKKKGINFNKDFNTNNLGDVDFKFKKTYDNYIRPSTLTKFNETNIDKDIYDSTAEYLYYVWIALSNKHLKHLFNYDFLDNITCSLNDIFFFSLITYSLLITFGLILYLIRRHYNTALNNLRQKSIHQHLNQKQLNKVKEKTLTKYDIEKINSKNNDNGFHELCGICREEYKQNEKIRVLLCSHIFHKECIDKWLLFYNNTCPYCKADISKKAK